MKFTEEFEDEHSFYRKVSEDGKFCICVYPVIYGFRVRAGYAGSQWFELDYCAGDKIEAIEEIYSIVTRILIKHRDFSVFPFQNRKPMFNDPECASKLFELAKGTPEETVNFEKLHELKRKYMSQIWK